MDHTLGNGGGGALAASNYRHRKRSRSEKRKEKKNCLERAKIIFSLHLVPVLSFVFKGTLEKEIREEHSSFVVDKRLT